MLNLHWVLFSLFQGLSMKTYNKVYFSLCLFLAISGRSRTQRKFNSREKFPIYGTLNTEEEMPFVKFYSKLMLKGVVILVTPNLPFLIYDSAKFHQKHRQSIIICFSIGKWHVLGLNQKKNASLYTLPTPMPYSCCKLTMVGKVEVV